MAIQLKIRNPGKWLLLAVLSSACHPVPHEDSGNLSFGFQDSGSDSGGDPDGVGGGDGLTLPFDDDQVWQLTRGYETGSHYDYGYDWSDERYALDFAQAGCESWRERAYPIKGGTVDSVGYSSGFGNYVIIDHGGNYKSRYAHLDEAEVEAGEEVDRYDVIGRVGNSGNVSGVTCLDHPGTHLHVAYYWAGEAEIPEPMSGHTNFTDGCWYGHNGWLDCNGDGYADDPEDDADTWDNAELDCTAIVPEAFETIQEAIDDASSGDVVCVEAGEYDEDLTFETGGITLRSIEGPDETHLYGVETTGYAAVVTFEEGASIDSVLEGFTLHGSGSRVITAAEGVTLRRLILDAGGVSKYGIVLSQATDVRVENVRIENADSYGLYAMSVADIELSNVIFANNGSAGIRVGGSQESTLDIVNSVFADNGSFGIWGEETQTTVENSIFVGHIESALFLEEKWYTLISRYNTFYDNEEEASEFVTLSSGNETENPEFNDRYDGDYTLHEDSPCIDDGNPSSDNDADGTPNDRGAYGGPLSDSW